jgi:hypothetical protein
LLRWFPVELISSVVTDGQNIWTQPSNTMYDGKCTPEEGAKLFEVVTELGGNNWVGVAALVPGRTNSQCMGRWANESRHCLAGFRNGAIV